MPKHNLAIILHKTDLTGGPGYCILRQLPYFDTKKFNFYFLATSQGDLTKEIEAQGFPVDYISYGIINKFWPFPFLKTFFLARRWFKKKKIDLAHFHFDYYRDAYLMAAKSVDVISIIHIHGPALDLKLSWLNVADGFIFNSAFTKQLANFDLGTHPHQFVIHNSFDPKTLPSKNQSKVAEISRKYGISKEQKIIGTIARVHRSKNLEDFIKLADAVKEEIKAKFLIIGNIQDQAYFNQLKQQVKDLRLTDKVVFTGHQSNIYDYYHLLDCLVHTAKAEPFGLIFLEAAAAKCPVLSYRAGGAKEILDSEDQGLLVEVGNITELKNSLLKILADQKLSQFLVENNIKNLSRFAPEDKQQEIEQSYLKVLNS